MRAYRWVLVGALLLWTCSAVLAADLDVRLYPSTTKVAKRGVEIPQGTSNIHLGMARNEYEAFQVLIAAGSDAVADVDLELSDLAGPGGATLPASLADLYLEYYVEITLPSPCDDFFSKRCDLFPIYQREAGWYPDALVPFYDPYSEEHLPVAVPFDVSANDFQTVFIDLYAPIDQKPGLYTGEVRVLVAGSVVKTLPVEVEIWDFEIPVERHITTAFGFNPASANNYHGGPDGINTPEEEQIYKNYEWEVHRHRMDRTEMKGEVSFSFDESDNLVPPDWTAYDAYIGPRVDGSYYPDGAGAVRFDLGYFAPGHGQGGMTTAQYSKAAKAMAEHLQEKGWLDNVYLYSTDEPWMPSHREDDAYGRIVADTGYLHADTDLWKGHVMVTGPWVEPLDAVVDIWCPVTPMYGHVYWPEGVWPEPSFYKELMEKGKELWFYVCNANFPGLMGYDVDTKLGYEPRLVKWGAWFEGASGFLYWRLTYWEEEDPWHVLINLPGFGELFSRQGDGLLIYPGNHDGPLGTGSPEGIELDGPVVSYRMKQIRDGLEDWEMFLLATELGGEEYTRQQVSRAYSAFGAPLTDKFDIQNPPWTLDENVVLDARTQIALKVQYLNHPDLYVDPEAPAVVEEEPVEPNPEVGPEHAESDLVSQDTTPSDLTASDATTDLITSDTSTEKGKSSGGCAASPTASPNPAWLLLALGLVTLALRRLKA